jgi:hypothetical protein
MTRILFISLLLAIAACSGGGVPSGVLKKDKMQVVLWDMLQADDFVREYMVNKDSTLDDTAEFLNMYERVFRIHKTSREEFARSFNYYQSHPALMKEVLDSMYNQFQRLPTATYTTPVVAAPTPVMDSAVHLTKPLTDSATIAVKADSVRRLLLDTNRARIKKRAINKGLKMN